LFLGNNIEIFTLVFRKAREPLISISADEQFRIPTSAIVDDNGNISHRSIRLDLTEEQLKHGYEFLEAKTNSEFMHGRKESERKIRLEKQVIQFEPIMSTDADNSATRGSSPIPVTEGHSYSIPGEYSCDMCASKFDKADLLQKHRAEIHKGPTNI